MRLGNWISKPRQLALDLSLGPILSSVYRKELADLKSYGLSRVFTPADDGVTYGTVNDILTAVTAVHEQLVPQLCQETGSKINPSKAHAL